VRGHEFVDLDDWGGILWNPDLRVSSLGEALRLAFTRAHVSMWAPLTTLSLQLDWALHGPEPAGFLLTNAALHAATSLLLLLALARLTGAFAPSAFVAAVFALHPLHVESVAWASERKDVLSGLCFALTLVAWERYVRSGRTLHYALALLALALGLLAKPMLVTVPCLLLLLDFWPLRRLDRAALREKLPMFALAAAVAAMTLYVQSATGAMSHGLEIPVWARGANAIDAYALYLVKSFWPTGLAAHYPHPGTAIPLARVGLALAGLLAISGLAWALRRSRPYLLTGWLWFGGMLVPVIGLVQVGVQARADRYTYLPQIGLALALAFGVRDAVAGHRSRERAALAAGLPPGSAFPHLRMGMGDAMQLRLESARPHFDRAIELEPEQAESIVDQLESMAVAHAQLGRPGPATETAELAVAIALETGQPERAREIRTRMARLRRGRPAPPPGSAQRR
jgi:hypothetical protein